MAPVVFVVDLMAPAASADPGEMAGHVDWAFDSAVSASPATFVLVAFEKLLVYSEAFVVTLMEFALGAMTVEARSMDLYLFCCFGLRAQIYQLRLQAVRSLLSYYCRNT